MLASRLLTLVALLLGYFAADFACAQNFGYAPDRVESERFVRELRERRQQRDNAEAHNHLIVAEQTVAEERRTAAQAVAALVAGAMLLAAVVSCCFVDAIVTDYFDRRANNYGPPYRFPVGCASIALASMTLAAGCLFCLLQTIVHSP